MGKTTFTSNIFCDISIARAPFTLRKEDENFLQERSLFWTSNMRGMGRRNQGRFVSEVIIPRKFTRDVSSRVAAALVSLADRLLRKKYMANSKRRRYPFTKRHVNDVDEPGGSFTGFRASQQNLSILQSQLKKLVKALEGRIKLIDSVLGSNGDTNAVTRLPVISKSQLTCAVKTLLSGDDCLKRKVERFRQRIRLAQMVHAVAIEQKGVIQNLKQFHEKVQSEFSHVLISQSSLRKMILFQGFRFKKNVPRLSQTDKSKNARSLFMKEYLHKLQDSNTEVHYFDWSSFSAQNFQQKSWSMSGEKSIVNDSYSYSSLHFLALMGPEKVEAVQFVRGPLCSPTIFNFMREVIELVCERAHSREKNVVVVLDNSPLNHSLAMAGLTQHFQFSLLFTAPNSSFLNPVEYMFAKVKAGLKSKVSLSKLAYQQRSHGRSVQ